MAWRVLKIAVIMTVATVAAVLLVARLTYRAVLYPAPLRAPDLLPAGAELHDYVAADGEPVRALIYPAEQPGRRRAVVYFHGNGEIAGDSEGLARELTSRGLTFVAAEYRGYGRSQDGSPPTEEGLYRDAEAVLRGLFGDGFAPADLTLWGNSLGSGVAVEMALRGLASRLILSAPFTSVPAVADSLIPLVPVELVIGDEYDNLAKAPAVRAETLIIHGDADPLVPFRMGVALSRAIPTAELIRVPGGSHGDLFLRERERLLAIVVAHAKGQRGGP